MIFGWCADGKHSECIKSYRPFFYVTKRVKRKLVEVLEYRDEDRVCQCKCHGGTPKKATRKKTNGRRK